MLRNSVSLSLPFALLLLLLPASPAHAQLTADQAVTVENSTGTLHVVDAATSTVLSSLFLGGDVADVTTALKNGDVEINTGNSGGNIELLTDLDFDGANGKQLTLKSAGGTGLITIDGKIAYPKRSPAGSSSRLF